MNENEVKQQKAVIDLLANEVLARQKLSFLLGRQFLIGVAYGLGASLGAAAILGSLVYVYRNFLDFLLERIA